MRKSNESTQRLAQRHEEQTLFQAFVRTCPSFAHEEVSEWSLAERDPPDVVCVTKSGRRIGVEICQWVHEREMRAGKLREERERKLLDAIEVPQPMNMSKNFWLAVFSPRARVNITPSEYPVFRASLLRLIDHVDATWPAERRNRSCRFAEMRCFPPLDKHLEWVQFVPGEAWPSDDDWIKPVLPADSFDDHTMADSLLKQISRKNRQCAALKAAYDELHLVVAYDQAVPYCSPIETPRRGVGETAREAAAKLAAERGPFGRAFLLIGVKPGLAVYQLL